MDKVNAAYGELKAVVNDGIPAAAHILRQLTNQLGDVGTGSGTGGGNTGGTGGTGTGNATYGPWIVDESDAIAPDVAAAWGLIVNPDGRKIVNNDAAAAVRFRSTNRPSRAPSWAWGDTPNGHNCWINPAKSNVRQEYTVLHEYAHTLDYRYLTPITRDAVRALLGVTRGWNQGHYDTDYSNVPSEAFADHFARAVTAPGEFADVLPGFYRPALNSAGQLTLLRIIERAMRI